MPLNTLFQCTRSQPALGSQGRIARVLFMPDLLNYFLTGTARTEYTIASTSGMLVPREGVWSPEMSDRLGIPSAWFAPLVDAGTVLGSLAPEVCRELALPEPRCRRRIPDTAVGRDRRPSEPGENTVYISSRPVVLDRTALPIIDDNSFAYNYSNEAGSDATPGFEISWGCADSGDPAAMDREGNNCRTRTWSARRWKRTLPVLCGSDHRFRRWETSGRIRRFAGNRPAGTRNCGRRHAMRV
jgi:hypothetical protein